MVEHVYQPTQVAPAPYLPPPVVAPIAAPAPVIAPHLSIYGIQQKNIMPSLAAAPIAPIAPIAYKRYDDVAVILVLFILLVIISHCKLIPCKDKC